MGGGAIIGTIWGGAAALLVMRLIGASDDFWMGFRLGFVLSMLGAMIGKAVYDR